MGTDALAAEPTADPTAGPASDVVDHTPGEATVGAVVLRLGSSRYAVATPDVAEVALVPRLTRVPGAPAWLAGLANWRGRMLPVLDLRPLLGADPLPLPSSARVVVLSRDEVVAAVLAEAVPGVYDGDLAQPAPAPPTLTPDAAALVAGQVTDAAGPIAVLEADAVLRLRDRVDRRRHG